MFWKPTAILLTALGLVTTSLSYEIEITCGKDDNCVKSHVNNYPDPYHGKINYIGSESIYGNLTHGINLRSDGKCVQPRFIFRGLSDLLWATWNLEELDTPRVITDKNKKQEKEFFKLKVTPIFVQKKKWKPKISLCQNIIASREVKFLHCEGLAKCKNDVEDEFCRGYYSATEINPVITWLNEKSKDKAYPKVEIYNETHISIDWGKAKEFKCGEDIKNDKTNISTHTDGYFTLHITESKTTKSTNVKIAHDRFTFKKDYISIQDLIIYEHPKCYTFQIEIALGLKFLALKFDRGQKESTWQVASKRIPTTIETISRPELFSTIILRSAFANSDDLAKHSKIKTINKNQIYLFIQHKDKEAPINCLKKQVSIEDMNNENKTIVETIEKEKVDLTPFMIKSCEETRLKITIKDTNDKKVIDKMYKYLPTVNADDSTANYFTVNEAKFETCSNLKFEIKCQTTSNERTKINREILSYNNETKKSQKYLLDGEDECKARAFLCEGSIESCQDTGRVDSEWTLLERKSSNNLFIGIGAGTGSFVLIAFIITLILCKRRIKVAQRKKKTQVNQRATTSKEKQHNIPPRKSIEDNEYYSSVRVTKDNKSTRKSVDDDEYYSSVRVNKDDDNFLEENNSNGKDTDKEDAYYWNAGEGNNTTADEDTYDSPAADEDTYNSPAADEDTYDSPAADEDTYDSPAADEDTYVSFVDEDRKDSAAVDINSQRARYLKSTKK